MGCSLRKMQETDLPLVLEWRNSDDVRKNMYTYEEISWEEHYQWWHREKTNSATRLLIAEVNGCAVGVVTFTRYTGVGGTASWAFYSGDSKVRGIGSFMEVAALEYAFEELKLRRLECEVLSFNYSVVLFHRKFGFKVEGTKRQAYQRHNDLYDIYCLAMLEKDWRLNTKLGKEKSNKKIPKMITKNVLVTDEMIKAFSCATKDLNTIHFDDEMAQMYGFEGRICHGMLAGSLFSGIFAEPPFGEGTVYLSQTLYFVKPIEVGAEVEVKTRVLSHIGRKVTLETTVKNGDVVCINGEAEIFLPKVIL